MSKSTITSAINGLTVLVTIAKLKTALNAILNGFYGLAPFEVKSTATTYATPTSNANFPYAFLFNKQGGVVSIAGRFKNNTTGTVSNQVLCAITDAELKVSVAQSNSVIVPYYGIARNLSSGTTVYFKVHDVSGVTTFTILGNLPPGSAFYEIISGSYNTLN